MCKYLEPATCLYALTVESSLFCKDLQDMDGRYGLPDEMPLPQSNPENDENERTSKSTPIRNDIESKAEGTEQIDDGPEEQENDNLGITSGDTRPPFEIQNLDRNQLFELVDLIQNEDVIFRKIVIEKRGEKEYKAYEASEAGSVEEEYDSDKENDKEQSESSEQKPIPPETQNT